MKGQVSEVPASYWMDCLVHLLNEEEPVSTHMNKYRRRSWDHLWGDVAGRGESKNKGAETTRYLSISRMKHREQKGSR